MLAGDIPAAVERHSSAGCPATGTPGLRARSPEAVLIITARCTSSCTHTPVILLLHESTEIIPLDFTRSELTLMKVQQSSTSVYPSDFAPNAFFWHNSCIHSTSRTILRHENFYVLSFYFLSVLEGFCNKIDAIWYEILNRIETKKHQLFANIGRICFLCAWKCSSIVILCFMETCSSKGKHLKISDKWLETYFGTDFWWHQTLWFMISCFQWNNLMARNQAIFED